jgi:ribosomal protein S18 acetylase RimI-like enzyme
VDVNDWQKPGGWISWVFVDEAFRRNGIARRLLSCVMAEAMQAKKTGLGLSVKPENESAQALYMSLGFRVCYTYEAGLLLMTLHL